MRNPIAIFTFLIFSTTVYTQESVTLADYLRAERFLSANTRSLVSHANVNPNWLDDGRMWYRNTTADGTEFIIVDPKAKTREHAFDHERLATALSNKDTTYGTFGLPFRSFEFTKRGRAISFDVKDKTYTCNLRNYGCTTKENKKGAAAEMSPMASFRRGRTQVLLSLIHI